MAAAMAADQKKPWTSSHYILAGLGGCLAVAVIVIIVSVVLSPGHIIFSVTHASRSGRRGGPLNLKLTVSANSTSHRAMVMYTSFSVVVSNSTSPTGGFTTDANVDTTNIRRDEYLTAPSAITVNASLHLLGGDLVTSFAGRRPDQIGFTVVLTTQVRFKIGMARTRMYDIKVSCPAVVFPRKEKGSKSPKPCM